MQKLPRIYYIISNDNDIITSQIIFDVRIDKSYIEFVNY